ncbi:hypothetical protein BC477_04160 [Clavibacter michiganensis subsp. michiganensis]|uniref:Uncharacterized protein n=1 Tax=Clavibacter michiganensis subsp. michiganensis TaxID=33013 RepID=A0A251XKC2_CLAMM|nr:hypothetical protein BC477_04160 [Clavibacter michiganensis subsp. michiganensis]OUE03906.1 hypothetical protein CMMCAS07_03095 [Clavibacter michiganensis subsp. michiganensis]
MAGVDAVDLPMPTPTEAPWWASRIAFDLTARQAFHANSRSASVCSSTGSPVARVHDAERRVPSVGNASPDCTRYPPEIWRASSPSRWYPSGA